MNDEDIGLSSLERSYHRGFAAATRAFDAMHAFFTSIPERATGSARCVPLDDFLIFSASGADALSFLHGQLTQDVTGLPQNAARLAGYCTAKGRLLATMVMWRSTADAPPDDAQLFGLVRQDLSQALLKRLSMFVLRAKVKLAPAALNATGVQVAADELLALESAAGGSLPTDAWSRSELASGTWISAPSADNSLRWWWIASNAQLDEAGAPLATLLSAGDAAAWHAADLAAGLPWISAATQDVFIPQTVNLDLIEGVSFTKGCYPGQEVVARSHYRGTVKRRMAFGSVAPAPETAATFAGIDIYDATQPNEPCGRVVDAAASKETLSILFETSLSALPEGDLRLGTVDGPAINVLPLPYSIQPA